MRFMQIKAIEVADWRKMPRTTSRYASIGDDRAALLAVYNGKGGVGKTTATFALGEGLAARGLRVLMVDCDVQQNLTQWALASKLARSGHTRESFEATLRRPYSLGCALASAGTPDGLRPADTALVATFERGGELRLLMGDDAITTAEERFVNASAMLDVLTGEGAVDILGAPYNALLMTADFWRADVVLLDLSPAYSSFNRALVGCCDFFVVPCFGDYASNQALRVLTRRMLNPDADSGLVSFAKRTFDMQSARADSCRYRAPPPRVKCLGAILTHTQDMSELSASSQHWVDAVRHSASAMLDCLRGASGNDHAPGDVSTDEAGLGEREFILAELPSHGPLGAFAQMLGIPAPYLDAGCVRQLCHWAQHKADEPAVKKNFKWHRLFGEQIDSMRRAAIDLSERVLRLMSAELMNEKRRGGLAARLAHAAYSPCSLRQLFSTFDGGFVEGVSELEHFVAFSDKDAGPSTPPASLEEVESSVSNPATSAWSKDSRKRRRTANFVSTA